MMMISYQLDCSENVCDIKNMVQLGDYVQIISATIYAAALLITILQFSAMRKNMFIQSVQQTYTTAMQTLSKNFSSKEYYEMTKESPVVSQYYSLVDSPQQYYIITESFDMFEFIFRLYKTKMIDEELWLRWEAAAKSTMTVPKFKKVWDKTKDIRTHDFREFIDSIQTKETQLAKIKKKRKQESSKTKERITSEIDSIKEAMAKVIAKGEVKPL